MIWAEWNQNTTMNSVFLGPCQYCTYDSIAPFCILHFLPFLCSRFSWKSPSVIKNICWHVGLMYSAPLLLYHCGVTACTTHSLILLWEVADVGWFGRLGCVCFVFPRVFFPPSYSSLWKWLQWKSHEWHYSDGFSITVPPHLIAPDPSPIVREASAATVFA